MSVIESMMSKTGQDERDDEEPTILPRERETIRCGVLAKKSIETRGIVWTPRLVLLTKDKIYFAKAEDPARAVIDYIRLSDLVECDLGEDPDPMSSEPEGADSVFEDPRLKDKRMLEVIFRTKEDSRNCGRSYIYRSSYQDANEWEQAVDEAVKREKQRALEEALRAEFGHSGFEMARARKKILIESISWQYLLAFVICLGFAIDVLESQMLPERDSVAGLVFLSLDGLITLFFTGDLLVNLFANSAHYFREFYNNPANLMDLSIVIVSIVGVYSDLQGYKSIPFKMVRVIRVLKVLPLISHLQALNRLVESIGSCIVPMVQAFIILMIVTLLYRYPVFLRMCVFVCVCVCVRVCVCAYVYCAHGPGGLHFDDRHAFM